MSEELDAFLAFVSLKPHTTSRLVHRANIPRLQSGIFSAVITLFVGQSATSLQPDNAQLTVDILRTISQQLANPQTSAIGDIQPFQSATFDIILNSLLNAGLLCSLIASGMSLWVKQWLREYVLDEPPLPRSRARVRLFRYHGLRAWKMRVIVACISILLQLSVQLFSTGVVMLAYKMNVTLAWVLLGLNAAWWAMTWSSALCPMFSPMSPFKSPLLRAIFHAAYQFRRVAGERFVFAKELNVGRFRTFEERELHETARDASKLELEALRFANREFWGSERLKVINECFTEVTDKEATLKSIERILRAHYGMTQSEFDSKVEYDLRTEDEGVKQLMRIWCQISVQKHGPSAKEGERHRLFDAVSRGVEFLEPNPVTMTIREGA